MRSAIKIIVVHPDPVMRGRLLQLIGNAGYSIIADSDDLANLPNTIRFIEAPFLLLIHCATLYSWTSESLLIRERYPRATVIRLTEDFQCSSIGANLITDSSGLSVLDDIAAGLSAAGNDAIAAGAVSEIWINCRGLVLNCRDKPPSFVGSLFSTRQAQVLQRLTYGDSNKAIARACCISEETVKVHVKAILRKIGARNRTEAAIWASAHNASWSAETTPSNGVRKPAAWSSA
jgi:two-component system nitrate/nitrite response regulator NarL